MLHHQKWHMNWHKMSLILLKPQRLRPDFIHTVRKCVPTFCQTDVILPDEWKREADFCAIPRRWAGKQETQCQKVASMKIEQRADYAFCAIQSLNSVVYSIRESQLYYVYIGESHCTRKVQSECSVHCVITRKCLSKIHQSSDGRCYDKQLLVVTAWQSGCKLQRVKKRRKSKCVTTDFRNRFHRLCTVEICNDCTLNA